MNIYFRLFFIFICSLFLGQVNVFSQIRVAQKPLLGISTLKSKLPEYNFDLEEKLSWNIEQNDTDISNLKVIKYAHLIALNINIKEKSKCDTIKGTTLVWRLKISSKDAFSLGLNFSTFKIPPGAKMFVYNNKKTLGAYTYINNKDYLAFSVEPIPGDNLYLEYSEPIDSNFKGKLILDGLLHDYKNVFKYMQNTLKAYNSSAACNVDINCEEGQAWNKEKNSICHILSGNLLGTGALVNNTANDGRPFLLTAHHVINTDFAAQRSIFYFNYENENCDDDIYREKTQSVSGSYLRATSNKIDFALLELSVVPPADYEPYYCGWDRSGNTPSYTVVIHHPDGDVKKISIDYDSPVTGSYEDPSYSFMPASHWQVLRWDVGTTQGGSSGAPLFNQNHLIIGDLTGGTAQCDNNIDDYFSKFSFAWDFNQSRDEQLKYWLDPLDISDETLEAYQPGAIELSKKSVCLNETFDMKINRLEGDNTCTWTLSQGANTLSFEGFEHSNISYNTTGEKLINAEITSNYGTRKISKLLNVYAETEADFDYIIEDKKISLINRSINTESYQWDFGDNSFSNETDPVHEFKNMGTYPIQLKAVNSCSESIKKIYLNLSYDKNIDIYPNPSYGIFTIDLTKIKYEKINWQLIDNKGAIVSFGILENPFDRLYTNYKQLSSGVYFLKINVDGQNIMRKVIVL